MDSDVEVCFHCWNLFKNSVLNRDRTLIGEAHY